MFLSFLFLSLAIETATKQLPPPKPIPRIGIPRGEVPRDIGPAVLPGTLMTPPAHPLTPPEKK